MSKLGKKPISIPQDLKVNLEKDKLILNGPKGSKELRYNNKMFSIEISKENLLFIKPIQEKKTDEIKRIWGMSRSLFSNAIVGVTKRL